MQDTQNQLSGTTAANGTKTGQALTATAISENVLDLRNGASPSAADESVTGPELWLVIVVQTSAVGGDAAKTVTFSLESSSTSDLATAPIVHWQSAAITGATLVAGYQVVRVKLPSAVTYKRYLGVRYTVSAGFTAFNLLAYLTNEITVNRYYASGFSIEA